jgi:hypothetical protein
MRPVFDAADFNTQLQRTLAKEPYGMARRDECLAIAHDIGVGDTDRWYRVFALFADRLRAAADSAVDAADPAQRRERYLRACEYYRNAFYFRRGELDDPDLQAAFAAHRLCFQHAADLFDRPVESASVPLDGIELQGYFGGPAADAEVRRPTLVVVGDDDATAEEGYPVVASGIQRGYNVFAFDGPGQGGPLIRDRMRMRPDWETVLPAVLDVVSSRSDVDSSRIAVLGQGVGSVLAGRAAALEGRVCALVLSSAHYDLRAELMAQLPSDPAVLAEPLWQRYLLPRFVAYGVADLEEYLQRLGEYTLQGYAEQIDCATLVRTGEGLETSAQRLWQELRERELLELDLDGRAGLPAFFTRMYDWLDTALG